MRGQRDESTLLARIEQAVGRVADTGIVWTSRFLDRAAQERVRALFAKDAHVAAAFFGGFEGAERRIACLYPARGACPAAAESIGALRVAFAPQYASLTHRDVLGALMSLGIERDNIGDILVGEGAADILLVRAMVPFVRDNLQSVGNAKVQVAPVALEELTPVCDDGEALRVTIASMRLDAVLAAALNISRSSAIELVRAERVSLNWRLEKKPDRELSQGDVLSIRAFGRLRVGESRGTTRKGRIALEIIRYH